MDLTHPPADREDLYRPGSELGVWTLLTLSGLLSAGAILEKTLHTPTALYLLSWIAIYAAGITAVVLSMDYQQVSKTIKTLLFAVAAGTFFAPGLIGVAAEQLKNDNSKQNSWEHQNWKNQGVSGIQNMWHNIQRKTDPVIISVAALQLVSWGVRTFTPALGMLASTLTFASGLWLSVIGFQKAKKALSDYRAVSVRVKNSRDMH